MGIQLNRDTTREQPPTLEHPLIRAPYANGDVLNISIDLVKAHLISDAEHFSFTLNKDELIVNGSRQPATIFQTFKDKYISRPQDRFIYSQYYTPHSSGSHCEVHTPSTDANLSNTH